MQFYIQIHIIARVFFLIWYLLTTCNIYIQNYIKLLIYDLSTYFLFFFFFVFILMHWLAARIPADESMITNNNFFAF